MSGAAEQMRQPTDRRSRAVVAAIYVALSVIVLIPIFSVRVPCLGDYLNHLARIHVLATVGHSPQLQRCYETQWHAAPYFGMDLPVMALATMLPIYVAGRLFVAVCVMMPVVAAATLHYALHRRVSLVPALAFLLCYNYLLARGFLSYIFSACLAVMLFAGWIATADRAGWRRSAVFAVGATIVYFCHAFGFFTYGIMVAGYEIGRAVRNREQPIARLAAEFTIAASQAIPVIALVLWSGTQGASDGASITQFGTFGDKALMIASPLYFPSWTQTFTGGRGVPLLGDIALLLLLRARLAQAAWPAFAAVLLTMICMPHVLLNWWAADLRLPLVSGIMLIGIASGRRPIAPWLFPMVLGAAAIIVAARSADAFVTLRSLDAQVAEVRQVISGLPVGSRLLVVEANETSPARLRTVAAEMTGHIGAVATIDRDAFVPFLFTGVTALHLRPEMRWAQSMDPMELTADQLREGFAQRRAGAQDESAKQGDEPGAPKYWLGWANRFDYVLVIHFGADMGQLPPVLRKVASVDLADLYQITTR
jgi:hypothetical protein